MIFCSNLKHTRARIHSFTRQHKKKQRQPTYMRENKHTVLLVFVVVFTCRTCIDSNASCLYLSLGATTTTMARPNFNFHSCLYLIRNGNVVNSSRGIFIHSLLEKYKIPSRKLKTIQNKNSLPLSLSLYSIDFSI